MSEFTLAPTMSCISIATVATMFELCHLRYQLLHAPSPVLPATCITMASIQTACILYIPTTVLESLLSRLESLLSSSGQFEGWLDDGEAKLTDCGAIGANLQRLLEQAEILEVSIYDDVIITSSLCILLQHTYANYSIYPKHVM